METSGPESRRCAAQGILPAKAYSAAKTLVLTAGVGALSGVGLLVLFYVMSSPTFGWTGARHPFGGEAAGGDLFSGRSMIDRPLLPGKQRSVC